MSLSFPSHAPDVALPAGRQPPPRVTARSMWAALLVATAVAMLFRLPELTVLAEQTVMARADAEVASDPTLRAIAINSGLWMALFLSLILAGIYLSLTSVMERHLLPVSRGTGRTRVGLLFCVAALSTVPVEVFCAATGTLILRGSGGYEAYLLAVGLLTPLGYWATLERMTPARRTAVWGLSLSLALLSYVV